MTVRAESMRARIIAMAEGGKSPRVIADALDQEYQTVANIVSAARCAGHPIPSFKGGGRSGAPYERRDKNHAERRTVTLPQALDYFELRALKKLLGADLEAIERMADEAGMSIAQYVTDVMRGHVRGFQG